MRNFLPKRITPHAGLRARLQWLFLHVTWLQFIDKTLSHVRQSFVRRLEC